jgi:predicted amidohydrolase
VSPSPLSGFCPWPHSPSLVLLEPSLTLKTNISPTNKTKALFLPEASDYIANNPTESIALARHAHESEFVSGLRDEARRNNIAIHVGVHEPGDSHGEDSGSEGSTIGKIRNTVLWIDGQGNIVQRYQKVHLFDVDIAGGPVLKESA